MTGRDLSAAHLSWDHKPELKEPYAVAGFHGWSNAGSVSSDTLEHLIAEVKPTVFATISHEPFLNYTLDRPIVEIENGLIHEIEPPYAELQYWQNPHGPHDVVFLLAKEPHYGWLSYSQIMLDVMTELGVKRLYTVGGVQDSISHTAPLLISVVASSPAMITETVRPEFGLRAAEYYGPISIHSLLVKTCEEGGIEGISYWGHVPAYLQKNPRLVARLITLLNEATGMRCPVQALQQNALELDRRLHEALLRDPDLRRFVETVEPELGSDEESTDSEKVIHLNNFLHRGSHDDPKQ
jgi:proteasome assembly chaperone (PAC2) family protein